MLLRTLCGGANVIDKIQCEKKIGSDKHKYLIALLERVQLNKPLYETVSKDLYDKARNVFYNNNTSEFEDWQIGNIGFLASYNGRWFDGRYAKSGYEKTKNGQKYRDYYQESKNNILKQAPNLSNIEFQCKDYREYKCEDLFDCVIYADPPYQGRKQYENSKDFDYKNFWKIMREWSKNNVVLISELTAPDDFVSIWEQSVNRSIKPTDKHNVTEKLFIHKSLVA